jgi:hypothetical protein
LLLYYVLTKRILESSPFRSWKFRQRTQVDRDTNKMETIDNSIHVFQSPLPREHVFPVL